MILHSHEELLPCQYRPDASSQHKHSRNQQQIQKISTYQQEFYRSTRATVVHKRLLEQLDDDLARTAPARIHINHYASTRSQYNSEGRKTKQFRIETQTSKAGGFQVFSPFCVVVDRDLKHKLFPRHANNPVGTF
jgi:hypothetical protein